MKPLYIIDGYAMIFRAYYAFARTPVKNTEGKNVSAIFGFFRLFLSVLKEYRPENILIALDPKGETFRSDLYAPYKATRQKTPEDLVEQIPLILNFIELSKVPFVVVDGYEADDVIATYATLAQSEDRPCYILSSDKDLMQLVGGKTAMLRPSKDGGFDLYDEAKVLEDKGVGPNQIKDYLSLLGDSSDNVPGVAGIGEKTAAKLLAEFGNLENIYQNLPKVSPEGLRTKLEKDKDNAFLSQKLVTLVCDLPDLPSIETLKASKIDFSELAQILKDQGIKQLSKDLDGFVANGVQNDTEVQDTAPTADDPDQEVHARYSSETHDFEIVTEIGRARAVLASVLQSETICFDTETDGLDPHSNDLCGLALCAGEKAYYLAFKSLEGNHISLADFVPDMIDFFATDKLWIGQNIKFDYSMLFHKGIKLGPRLFDTMIAAWMIDSTMNTYNMDFLAKQYLSYEPISFDSLFDKDSLTKAKKDSSLLAFSRVPLERGGVYSAEDAWVTFKLYEKLNPMIKNMELEGAFFGLEMPLIPILAEMEYEGMRLEPMALFEFGNVLEGRIEKTEKELYELVGRPFNIGSTKQLQDILFTERKLPTGKKTKTGYSTDTSVLEELAALDPVPQKILEYRGLAKLKNTYVDTLPGMINPKTGRVHTTFHQAGTATGRIASKDPNLQNFPIKDEDGRRIRQAFIARDGQKLVSADYSQIELVVLAHLSQDPGLIRAFSEGIDVHRLTGSLIFKCEPKDVSPEQRRIAKTINFGVIYGMSAFRLSMELKIPRSEASHFIKEYFESYPNIKAFIATVVASCQEHGGVRTMSGRFRPIPAISSANHNDRQAAERVAVNTPIQGTAADIVKKSMLLIDQAIRQDRLKAKLILQVHDEIIIECPETEVVDVKKILYDCMPKAWNLSVPLGISVESGQNWGDFH